jgi:hypothetical protein
MNASLYDLINVTGVDRSNLIGELASHTPTNHVFVIGDVATGVGGTVWLFDNLQSNWSPTAVPASECRLVNRWPANASPPRTPLATRAAPQVVELGELSGSHASSSGEAVTVKEASSRSGSAA